MRLESKNLINNSTNFRGLKAPTADELEAIKKLVGQNVGDFQDTLIKSIKSKSPNLVKKIGDFEYVSDFSIWRKIANTVGDIALAPMDLLDFIAKKLPKSSLNNLELLKRYRNHVQLINEVNAFQGLQENTLKIIRNYKNGAEKVLSENGNEKIKNTISEKTGENIVEALNRQMSNSIADYDTKKERFITRLISGFTAAIFLGNDFYNKAIQKGKNTQEANKEKHTKQMQEVKENICEGILQFGALACFSKWVNKSVWAPAIITALIGLISRIVSRKMSNMPLGRIKIPNSSNKLTFNEFQEKIKSNEADKLFEKKTETKNKAKKPLLCLENIIGFCSLSILAGYALRFGKSHVDLSKIKDKLTSKLNVDNIKITNDIIAKKDDLAELASILEKDEKSYLVNKIRKIIDKSDENINLGSDYATKKIFGVEVNNLGLKKMATSLFDFAKEVLLYPYKIARKLEYSITKTPEPKEVDLKDIYNIKNIYLRFMDFKEKYGNDEEKLYKEFTDYLNKMLATSNNMKSSSSTDNSKIAVIAQTLGTLTGIWFNMNDEYNLSVRNGSTKYEAEKDARLRGVNKFLRMSVQVIISGSLNKLFLKQYNNSLLKAGGVVALSTFLTDVASRILSGMPNKKMTKEEIDNYQKEHKEGIMSWYYKGIDKIAS